MLNAIKAVCAGFHGKSECDKDQFRSVHAQDIDDQTWNDFFVFTFVRNPWTRMLSAYKMFTRTLLRKCAFIYAPGCMVHLAWPSEQFSPLMHVTE